MDEHFWCIGGGLLQKTVIDAANELDLKVIVTDGSNNCFCKNFADKFFQVDIFDVNGHINLARDLIKRTKIKGVLAAGIDAPITMSKLCEFLNLPGVSSSISETVHDKFKFREFSAKNNICVPKYEIYKENDLKNLTNILDKYTLPFIIKNVDSSGSRGTKIFYSRDKKEEERIAKEAITVSKSRSFLVESVWTGKECTVETLFDKEGIFHKCFITDRKFDYSNGYPIELGLVSPSQLSSKIQEECFTLAENVSNKLGIKIGAAKFDMIITNDGPKIIEMTTRLSGGFDCQYVVPASTGKNVVMAAVMTACGTNFPDFLLENKFNKVCVTGSHWPENGRIKNIKNLEKVKNMEGVEHIFFRKKVGDLIENYSNCTDRVDFIICSGINYDKANKNLEAAISELKIEITNE